MIIGFGDTETHAEEKIERALREFGAGTYPRDVGYFDETFVKQVRNYADELGARSRAQADEYKTAETHPDRYSYFWPTTLSDASHIAFILRFHHINRRHALAADGWGLMPSERMFYVYSQAI